MKKLTYVSLLITFILLQTNFIHADVGSSNLTASKVFCSQVLKPKVEPANLLKSDYRIDLNESMALDVLSIINFLFVNYKSGEFVEVTREATRIIVPTDRWDELFYSYWSKIPTSFNISVEELRKVIVKRTDNYSDGSIRTVFEQSLLISSSVYKDPSTGVNYNLIELDPRLGSLLSYQFEELVSVMNNLSNGSLWSERIYQRPSYGRSNF